MGTTMEEVELGEASRKRKVRKVSEDLVEDANTAGRWSGWCQRVCDLRARAREGREGRPDLEPQVAYQHSFLLYKCRCQRRAGPRCKEASAGAVP
mmetsp:Transcript_28950/g.65611  ORF Transcript_28950/g.65611 Transcript_28950/m.65611 type:complete len:95 (+) Transcript_28950:3257-3541(+)